VSDIGGSTIHSELNLQATPIQMKKNHDLHSKLEERVSTLETLILDEVYFLGTRDLAHISEYLGIATGRNENTFGGLNFATCGDPCQLPPPKGKTVFDRKLVNCFKNNNLNDLHENTRQDVKGIHIWHQIDHVVVLEEIMRQRGEPILIDLLQQLHIGLCTPTDKELLDRYVLISNECSEETRALTDVRHWIDNLDNGCPLIVYHNAARGLHNNSMVGAFAGATGQDCDIYHAKDMKGRGSNKRQLMGLAAEIAWAVPVKKANDLGGRMPYILGMPVFCTENIATELGISNGSPGTLVSIAYEIKEGRRYALSADIDFKAYHNSKPTVVHPHRVTLKPIPSSIQYLLPGSDKPYTANRWQLPLIPAFAFTSHNVQGRSLDVCCIDLAGCPLIQSTYVMLSQVWSLKGLCILRPFVLDRIQNHISQELRSELQRVEVKAERIKAYSREKLSWFYDLVPEGHVDCLKNLDLDMMMGTIASQT
jgi:hypothetical protein